MDRRHFVQAGLAATPALGQDKVPGRRNLLLATGVPYGTFNAVGEGICQLINARDATDFACRPRGSAGSAANVNSLGRRIEELGLAQADVVWFAVNGTRDWKDKPIPALRVVMPLYFEAVTLVTRVDTRIKSVADLKGRRVSIANAGSGARVNALDVLSWHGLQPGRDFTPLSFDLTNNVTKLITKEIDAFFIYELTKTLVERWDDLRAVHAAVPALRLEDVLRQSTAPFHPGAVRYLSEHGVM